MTMQNETTLIEYVIEYLKEEKERFGKDAFNSDDIEALTQYAIEAYEGGAR